MTYQQGHPFLGQRLGNLPPNQLATTIVTYDEQITGRLAIVHKAGTDLQRVRAYSWLQRTLDYFCRIPVLPFDEPASVVFQ